MKALPAALALAGSAALVLFGAAPAVAAGNTIDAGDHLYAINCDSQYNDSQLFSVESSTAFSTPIGDGDGGPTVGVCAAQPAWNPTTGISYYIQWNLVEATSRLATIDPATGESTFIGDFVEVQGDINIDRRVNSIAIGADGSAYALDSDGYLYSLDLATAELSPISPTGYEQVYAFAYDAVTNAFYFIQQNGDIYALDVNTGFATYLASYALADDQSGVNSLQFDGAGTWWIMFDEPVAEFQDYMAKLASFSLATVATPAVSGIFTDDPFYTQAILIIPGAAPAGPALAATGSTADGVVVATGAAAILALIGAGLLIARNRRTV